MSVSFRRLSSNHWFKVIKYLFLGSTSVYKSDVDTLFKLSSKSAITTASKFKPPKVYLFSSLFIFFSLFGSLLYGFVVAKRLSYSKEKIIFSGFFSCFTSFSGFIYFLYQILNQGDWIKFIIFFNLIIIVNLFTMLFGFWISRKIT